MKKISIILFLFLNVATLSFAGPTTAAPKRIVSLAPSTTELLFALGLGDKIVGVTSFCDYPEEAKSKPKVGGMSNPSLEAVVTMKPDLVVMTTDGNPQGFEERLRSMKIKTYVFAARRLSELPQGIRQMGAGLGTKEKAEALAKEIEAALKSFKTSGIRQEAGGVRGGKGQSAIHKKVLFIVWPEPLIVAGPGTAIDDAISLLGHENIAAGAKSTYPKYSIEEVIRQSPDVLFIGTAAGMDMGAVSQGILKRLTSTPAVRNGAVCYVSENLYRLGPRVVKGIGELEECLK